MAEKMTVREAAELLGMTECTVRIGLQKGVFPFGIAFKTDPNHKHYHYVLYPGKVREYAGVKYEEVQD